MCPCALSPLDLKKHPIPPAADWDDKENSKEAFDNMSILGFNKIEADEDRKFIDSKIIKIKDKIKEKIESHGEDIGKLSYNALMRLKTLMLMDLIVNNEKTKKDVEEIIEILNTS